MKSPRLTSLVFALFPSFVIVPCLLQLLAPPLSAQDSDTNKDGGDNDKDASTEEPKSVDQAFVEANLKRFLQPTSMKILEDGRVTLTFDFREKVEDHGTIFSPAISGKLQAPFRWSLDSEFIVGAGLDDRGIRVSNNGMALLNCWFEDNVEAEITFVNGVNFNKRMYASVIFCNDKGIAVGSNLGTQCTMYSKGRPRGAKGELEPVTDGGTIRNKLVVRGGEFEAHRNGRKKTSYKYSEKSFPSGRVGFTWGGNLMAVISELKVTGKIDAATMAKFIQKSR